MYKTLADSIQDLYEITVAPSGLLVTDSMVQAVDKARRERDPKGIGDVLSQLFNGVASKAAGFQLKDFTRDEIANASAGSWMPTLPRTPQSGSSSPNTSVTSPCQPWKPESASAPPKASSKKSSEHRKVRKPANGA